MALVVVLLLIIFVCIIAIRRQRKGKYVPSRGSIATKSKLSKDYFFGEEEKVEMSPIDIVPLEVSRYELESGTPYHGTMSNGLSVDNLISASRTALRSSQALKPAGKQPLSRHGSRTLQVDSSDIPQYGSVINNARASQYESPDEDDLIDLQFSENPASQPYLSLGLTPPSQLSPDNSDMDFFPSMPPPVGASASSINTSMGMSVDGPFDDHVAESSFMPEAVPIEQHRNQRTSRKSKVDNRLPTVPEIESLPDSFHHRAPPEFSGSGNSGGIEDPDAFVFPSAYSSPKAFHGPKRRSSPTKGKEPGATVMKNDFADQSQESQSRSQADDAFQKVPNREKEMREAARREELAKQKELLRLKKEEEERTKRESTKAKIMRDYNGWRYDYDGEKNEQSSRAGNIVLKQTAMFEAAAELAAEGSQSPGMRQSMRRSSMSNGVQHRENTTKALSDAEKNIGNPIKYSHVQVTRL